MAYSSVKLYRKNTNNEKSVIIYYKHKSTLRYLTSVKVKEKDFDKKSARVKPSDVGYKMKNEIIGRVHEGIEHTIVDYIREHGIKPDCDYLKKQIKLHTGYSAQTIPPIPPEARPLIPRQTSPPIPR